MSFGEYSFLPWLRRGIANQLQTPATATSRAALAVSVRVRSDTASLDVPPRQVLLVGPGDVTGFAPEMVLRTEPRAGTAKSSAVTGWSLTERSPTGLTAGRPAKVSGVTTRPLRMTRLTAHSSRSSSRTRSKAW